MDQTSSNDFEHDPLLLERYFAGDATPDDIRQVEQWIAVRPERRAFVDALRMAWNETGRPTPVPEYDVDTEWVRLSAHAIAQSADGHAHRSIGVSSRTIPFVRRHPSSVIARTSLTRMPLVRRLAITATVVAAAVTLVIVGRQLPSSHGSATLQSYSTGSGQRATITLADGSRVTLAPQTTLRVERDFGGATRTVILIGEGYFDVAHIDAAPFIVRTGAVTTRVLGTTFAVRHYVNDPTARIAVATGKVAVSADAGRDGIRRAAPRGPVTISAGQIGIVTDSTVTTATVTDIAPYTGWVTGRLVFDRTRVSDVLATVGRWYGYQFRLSDSVLAARHLSASFEEQSSADVLEALRTALNVTMTFDGSIVTLHPRQNSATPRDSHRDARRESQQLFQTKEVGR